MRLTARSRLALLYLGLVLVTGVVLMALTYVLVRQSMNRRVLLGFTTDRPPDLTALRERFRAETLSELLTQATIALAVVTLLAAVLGWLVAGRILRPIRAISATAQRLSAENLSERVPVTAPADELAALAGTINGMLDRIQHGIAERDRVLASQRMFTANAAHELRTPLATMRTAIDVTLDGDPSRAELLAMAGDVAAAVDHSRRTLDGLLALARSHPRDQRPADLAEVARASLAAVTRADVTLHADLRPAPVSGEPVLLERLASNLLDNAARYNHAGGHIAVGTGTDGGRAFLRVSNSGPAIRAEEAEALLEPFVRGDGVRTHTDGGAGLGLSIVRAIAAAHHGEVTVAAREAGGLDVTVLLG
ncbi:sensor histidine kinase [Lentzea flava]|uniref:histidine kinase n=1 Tax=Lentzea flava TaxID=103732 RepID=A0ABQ2UJK7_9PSEU|nr:ATP-binding protein [Lentzea flava]MCP2199063.1 Signal transduction histidine kinase [Lentzea flava]GGU34762.1 two-component sensor histidine kinase [Lentzea flava]